MSLNPIVDPDLLRQQRERVLKTDEEILEEAFGAAIRDFLRKASAATSRRALTAAGSVPNIGPQASQLFTLGQAKGWWDNALDQHAVDAVSSIWRQGHFDTRDGDLLSSSAEALGEYVARVKDRLSTTATPLIPDRAFESVRTALAQELSLGSSTNEVAQRLAAELSWDAPATYWRERGEEVTKRISDILDPYGPPGSPEREYQRLNNPLVRDLQAVRSEAVQQADAVKTTWETRATTIARTESTAAFNAGAQNALIVEGASVKVWLATFDDRTRPDHAAAHGQCVGVTDSFTVGGEALEMPGDPFAPPSETVNCRCTIVGGPSCETLDVGTMPDEYLPDDVRADVIDIDPITADESADVAAPEEEAAPASPGEDYVRANDPVLGEVEVVDLGDQHDGERLISTSRAEDDAVKQRMLDIYSEPNALLANDVKLVGLAVDAPELRSVAAYQGSGFSPINRALRKTDWRDVNVDSRLDISSLAGSQIKTVREVVKDVDRAMDATPRLPQPVTAYRRVGGDYGRDFAQLPVGAVQRDSGFLSTTVVHKPAVPGSGSHTIIVDVPKGSRGIYMNAQGQRSLYKGEEELLLPRGAVLKVVEQGDGYTRVRIEGYAREAL